MTLHFIHVAKTGGIAIRTTLRHARLAIEPDGNGASTAPKTPYGQIQLHDHRFLLRDVPAGEYAFFCVRDPISRFVSGFNSRLRKGAPRFHSEWSDGERAAFAAFPTPLSLAIALGSDDPDERGRAEAAMRDIRHLAPMEHFLGTPRDLWAAQDRIVYIARQETLDADWRQLLSRLNLPDDLRLPADPVKAHRSPADMDTSLDAQALARLRAWYRRDFELVEYCDRVRTWRGWGPDVHRYAPVDAQTAPVAHGGAVDTTGRIVAATGDGRGRAAAGRLLDRLRPRGLRPPRGRGRRPSR